MNKLDENYNPEFISVSDDNGDEYVFEVLDRLYTDDGKEYVAVVPADEEEDDDAIANIELIILESTTDENGDAFLAQIEDDDTYDAIEELFIERLSEFYDIDEEE